MAKILIVDDDEDIRELLMYNLKREGHDVSCAENGLEALDMIQSNIPDLIILDVMMPKMDGIEFCDLVKADPSKQNIIICFLTARNEDYSQIAGLESGGDDYVSKPIKPKVLISRINALLRRNKLKEDEGMLFVFDHSDKYSFWMKDMNFPIDIIWIGEDLQIVFIKKNSIC